MKGVLRAIGCYWYGFVLLTLIWSTSVEHVREIIGTASLMPYLLAWAAALIPGIIILYFAEKMPQEA